MKTMIIFQLLIAVLAVIGVLLVGCTSEHYYINMKEVDKSEAEAAWIGSPVRVPTGGDLTGFDITLNDTVTFRKGETIDNSQDGTIRTTGIAESTSHTKVGGNLSSGNASIPYSTDEDVSAKVYKYQYSALNGSAGNHPHMSHGAGGRQTNLANVVPTYASVNASYMDFDANDEEIGYHINVPSDYIGGSAAGDMVIDWLCKTMSATTADTLTITVGVTSNAASVATLINAEELTIDNSSLQWDTVSTSNIGASVTAGTSIYLTVWIKQINTGEPNDGKRVYFTRLKYLAGIRNDI